MGKSTRTQQDPFAYKPEYNNQGATPVGQPTDQGVFGFKPEYNQGIKKKDGGMSLQPSLEESAPTQSTSQSSGESSIDFLSKDIDSNDFFTALSAQTDQYFLPVTKERQNREIASATKQQVFTNPTALGKYNDSRIQKLRKDIDDLKSKQSSLVTYYDVDPAASSVKVIENESAYNQYAAQIKDRENYINKLKQSVADVATDFVMRDKGVTNFNPKEAGRQIMKLADPELEQQFSMVEKGGATLPGIRQSELERLGIDAAINYTYRNPQAPNSPELARLAEDYKTDYDKRNFEITGQRVREKLGAELYREGKSGFWGYSNEDLDKAAARAALTPGEQSVYETYVKPLERRKLGTDIPGSGFFRSFRNAAEKSVAGAANTLADITGVRKEADVAQDLLNSEIGESRFRAPGESPTAKSELTYLRTKEKADKLTKEEQSRKLELEKYVDVRNGWSRFKDGVGDLTGQVALMALTTRGLGAAGKVLASSGEAGGLLGGMTRGAVGTALQNETVGLFINGYLNSYDNYLQQAVATMPGDDKAADRDAYAKTMAAVEGFSERIFPDTKILNAFTKNMAPAVKDISQRFINKEITQAIAREELQGALVKYLKPFGKEYAKSTLQESSEEAVVDLANGIAQSIYGGQPFDISKTGQQAVDTFLATALYSPLIAGMAAHGASRRNNSQNAFFKSSLFNMASDPAQYLKAVEDLQLSGDITQQEANEKVKLIKSASDYLLEMPAERTITQKVDDTDVPVLVPMDYPEINTYLLHRLNEGILQERIDNSTDEVLNSQLNKELKRSQDIRKGIFDGSIAVTPDLVEVADSPEKAQELGIQAPAQVEMFPRGNISVEVSEIQQDINDDDVVEQAVPSIAPPLLPEAKAKEAEDFVSELITEGVLNDVYSAMATANPTGFLKMIADQAQNVTEQGEVNKTDNPEAAARETFGDTLVDYAIELFPTQNKQQNEEAQRPEGDKELLTPEPETSKISVIQPGELRKPEIITTQSTQNEESNSQEGGGQKAGQASQEGDGGEGQADEVNKEGAEPEAEAPLTESTVEAPLSGITHEATEETRQEFGLGESYEKSAKRDEDLEAQAIAEIKKGYDVGALLSKIQKGTIPTDVENTILKKYKATLEAKIAKDPSDDNLNELKQLVQATDKIGSETGRALRSRQGMELRDDSLAAFFMQDLAANLQAPLTEKQKETVLKEYEAIIKAQTDYDAKIAALEAENARLRAEQVIKKTKASSGKQKKTHEDYVKERKDAIESAKEKLKKLRGESQITIVPYANELFAIAPDVAKVVKSLVEEGVNNLADISKSVFDTFKEIVPDLTEADVNNIIAGEYNEKRQTKNQISATLRDLRDEATLINRLDALLRGEEPKQERQKIKRNQQIEELRKKIKDFQDEKANAEREEKDRQKQSEKEQKAKEKEAAKKTPEQKALDTLKSRNKTEIKKLEKQLASGNFDPEDNKPPLQLDKEANELKDKLIKLRNERAVRLLREEYNNRNKIRKAFDTAANILNVPRSLMSSIDFSAPLRQSALVTVTNPKVAAIAGIDMFRKAFSQKLFDRWFFDLQQTDRYQLMQQAGLYVADPHDPRLSVREEQYMSNLAEKIPIIGKLVKGSERAYVSYLNKMRVDLFNRYTDAFENDGFTWDNNPDLYKGLAKFLNNSTGRGDLGAFEVASPILNSAFFSPRLIASRINILGLNPMYYIKLPPKIREAAIVSFLQFVSVGFLTLQLIKQAYGCDEDDESNKDCATVEEDPRSSDFGKVRIGNTRWDIWGGFQQYVRIVTQAIIRGEAKSINSGAIEKLDGTGKSRRTRASQLVSFFRGKLAPVPSFVWDQLEGRDVLGNKVTIQESTLSRLTPLMLTDLYGAVKEDGVKALFTQGIPATFGVGVQNYLPKGFEGKDPKDPVYKFLYEKNLNLSAPEKKKDMSDEQYQKFLKAREPIIRDEWAQAIEYGIMINENGNPTIDENTSVQIIPANKATYEQLSGLMKAIGTRASREVLKEE